LFLKVEWCELRACDSRKMASSNQLKEFTVTHRIVHLESLDLGSNDLTSLTFSSGEPSIP